MYNYNYYIILFIIQLYCTTIFFIINHITRIDVKARIKRINIIHLIFMYSEYVFSRVWLFVTDFKIEIPTCLFPFFSVSLLSTWPLFRSVKKYRHAPLHLKYNRLYLKPQIHSVIRHFWSKFKLVSGKKTAGCSLGVDFKYFAVELSHNSPYTVKKPSNYFKHCLNWLVDEDMRFFLKLFLVEQRWELFFFLNAVYNSFYRAVPSSARNVTTPFTRINNRVYAFSHFPGPPRFETRETKLPVR